MGQTDGRIALFQNAPLGRGHNKDPKSTTDLAKYKLRRFITPFDDMCCSYKQGYFVMGEIAQQMHGVIDRRRSHHKLITGSAFVHFV